MKKRIAIIIILLLIFGGVMGGYLYLKGLGNPAKPSSNEHVVVEIPMGSSTSDIAAILVENGIITDEFKFKLFSRMNEYDGMYQAGTYTLSPSMDATQICDIICSGETTNHEIVVPEGYTLDQIGDAFEATGALSKDKFLSLVANGDYSEYSFLAGAVKGEKRLEGYLWPATYSVPVTMDEDGAIRMMLDTFNEEIEKIDYQSKLGGLSFNEIMTIASIIEKETLLPEDKPIVASVIYNRLKKGMKLQMDSTVNYALGQSELNVTYDDMEFESPYNTYVVEGLPPGPICAPGKDSIEAALNPAKTKYMYFVLSEKGDGSNNFSETYEEFEKDRQAFYDSLEG